MTRVTRLARVMTAELFLVDLAEDDVLGPGIGCKVPVFLESSWVAMHSLLVPDDGQRPNPCAPCRGPLR